MRSRSPRRRASTLRAPVLAHEPLAPAIEAGDGDRYWRVIAEHIDWEGG
jgi:hypothetical protein